MLRRRLRIGIKKRVGTIIVCDYLSIMKLFGAYSYIAKDQNKYKYARKMGSYNNMHLYVQIIKKYAPIYYIVLIINLHYY